MNWQSVWAWIDYLRGLIFSDETRLSKLEKQDQLIMAAIDDLTTAVNGFKTEVATDLAALAAKVKTLSDQLAAAPNVDPALTALAAELTQATADTHAKYAPPAPSGT